MSARKGCLRRWDVSGYLGLLATSASKGLIKYKLVFQLWVKQVKDKCLILIKVVGNECTFPDATGSKQEKTL